jgi:hypothetical protein
LNTEDIFVESDLKLQISSSMISDSKFLSILFFGVMFRLSTPQKLRHAGLAVKEREKEKN